MALEEDSERLTRNIRPNKITEPRNSESLNCTSAEA
jgi:hypothetical protein